MTRKNALLRAAKILFAEYGYAGTTFKKISDRAGVALGLLSHHYGNKEYLFVAATIDVLKDLENVIASAIEKEQNGFQKVLCYCGEYMEFAINPNSHYELLSRCLPYSTISQNAKKQIFPKIENIYNILLQCLVEGKIDGSIDANVSDKMADIFFCTLVGSCRVKLLHTPLALKFTKADLFSLLERSLSPKSTFNPLDSYE